MLATAQLQLTKETGWRHTSVRVWRPCWRQHCLANIFHYTLPPSFPYCFIILPVTSPKQFFWGSQIKKNNSDSIHFGNLLYILSFSPPMFETSNSHIILNTEHDSLFAYWNSRREFQFTFGQNGSIRRADYFYFKFLSLVSGVSEPVLVNQPADCLLVPSLRRPRGAGGSGNKNDAVESFSLELMPRAVYSVSTCYI